MWKNKIFVLVILLISILSITETKAILNIENTLVDKVIYIDPGHGGIDPGAVYKDLKESDINLKFSKEIGKRLEELGCIVYYTRDGDYDLSITTNRRKKSDLSNRVKLINDSKADIYISIHVNSENSSTWYGTQVFYADKNAKNKLIAEAVQGEIVKNNISKRKVSRINNIYMYDRINVPGILIEIGFITNYSDRNKMLNEQYVERFSQIIVQGIQNYFKI